MRNAIPSEQPFASSPFVLKMHLAKLAVLLTLNGLLADCPQTVCPADLLEEVDESLKLQAIRDLTAFTIRP